MDWATIKVRWDLTATASEIAALKEMLATCSATPQIQEPTPAATATPAHLPAAATIAPSPTYARPPTFTPALSPTYAPPPPSPLCRLALDLCMTHTAQIEIAGISALGSRPMSSYRAQVGRIATDMGWIVIEMEYPARVCPAQP